MSSSAFEGRCILVLGATSGIGKALAEAMHDMPHQPTVIAAGRRKANLDELTKKHERMESLQIDQSASFDELKSWVKATLEQFPNLDSVFFVAGVQYRIDLSTGDEIDWQAFQTELNINYTSLVTLAQLFVPHLKAKAAEGKQATLVTVTSGLAFVPMPATALYCATKAAVRSYTISLRQLLRSSNVKVIEIAPPLVESELHDQQGGELMDMIKKRWMPLTDFTEEVMEGLAHGQEEIAVGLAKNGWTKFGKGVVELVADAAKGQGGSGKHS